MVSLGAGAVEVVQEEAAVVTVTVTVAPAAPECPCRPAQPRLAML